MERPRTRIGAWRLLDLAHATMPFRASLLGGGGALPEYGPPDAPIANVDPVELPGSNIGDGEQQQAVARERARRFIRRRRTA
jgi:hypothetical protein